MQSKAIYCERFLKDHWSSQSSFYKFKLQSHYHTIEVTRKKYINSYLPVQVEREQITLQRIWKIYLFFLSYAVYTVGSVTCKGEKKKRKNMHLSWSVVVYILLSRRNIIILPTVTFCWQYMHWGFWQKFIWDQCSKESKKLCALHII